jgi:hypothetical protein
MASAQSIATGRGKRSVDIAPDDALGLSGMLSFPANFAKGIAPIAAASIWSFTHGYVSCGMERISRLNIVRNSLLRRGQSQPANDGQNTLTMSLS